MGVEILWFMPITPISKIDRKGALGSYYAVADYTTVNPEFGTMDDWKSLVKMHMPWALKLLQIGWPTIVGQITAGYKQIPIFM